MKVYHLLFMSILLGSCVQNFNGDSSSKFVPGRNVTILPDSGLEKFLSLRSNIESITLEARKSVIEDEIIPYLKKYDANSSENDFWQFIQKIIISGIDIFEGILNYKTLTSMMSLTSSKKIVQLVKVLQDYHEDVMAGSSEMASKQLKDAFEIYKKIFTNKNNEDCFKDLIKLITLRLIYLPWYTRAPNIEADIKKALQCAYKGIKDRNKSEIIQKANNCVFACIFPQDEQSPSKQEMLHMEIFFRQVCDDQGDVNKHLIRTMREALNVEDDKFSEITLSLIEASITAENPCTTNALISLYSGEVTTSFFSDYCSLGNLETQVIEWAISKARNLKELKFIANTRVEHEMKTMSLTQYLISTNTPTLKKLLGRIEEKDKYHHTLEAENYYKPEEKGIGTTLNKTTNEAHMAVSELFEKDSTLFEDLIKKCNPDILNLENESNQKPLELAIHIGSCKAFKILIKYGAKLNWPDNKMRLGTFEAYCALEYGRMDIFYFIVSQNLDVDLKEMDSLKPIIHSYITGASIYKCTEAQHRLHIEELRRLGVQLDSKDERLNNILHMVALSGNVELARSVKSIINPWYWPKWTYYRKMTSKTNQRGQTPLEIASNSPDMTAIIKEIK